MSETNVRPVVSSGLASRSHCDHQNGVGLNGDGYKKSLPTFREIRLQYGISLEAMDDAAEHAIDWSVLQQFDETARADPYTVDDLLFVLSELSGQVYTRPTVDVTCVLARPPACPLHPRPLPGLPDYPTLFDLYTAYRLDLDWLAEAVQTSQDAVWECLMHFDATSQIAVDLVRLIGAYTQRDYATELMQEQRTSSSSLQQSEEYILSLWQRVYFSDGRVTRMLRAQRYELVRGNEGQSTLLYR